MKTKLVYKKPRIKQKPIKINFFLRGSGRGLGLEGVLLAGCTCWDGWNGGGRCACSE